MSGFINDACAPSLVLNGKTTCKTKKSVLKKESIVSILRQVQLRWTGHVSRMEDTCACPKLSSSTSSKNESVIVALQESVTKIS